MQPLTHQQEPPPGAPSNCLSALHHAQNQTPASQRTRTTFPSLLDSTTNPSHRLLEITIFSLLRHGLTFMQIAAFLEHERTHAAQGITQLRDALRTFHFARLLNGEGARSWVEWRVATWPRWPRAWEVAMLGGWALEVWAWAVHEAGENGKTGILEDEGEGRETAGVCCHGFAILKRKRWGTLRERLRAMV
ncbi:uncharacterized protein CC84DRAFT_1253918 [Paraphaeosphaeria sporulosa]|uniref:Uncharacterized protein n=1 Tax=Paraphaeosphaeria sporulosa TaxID=1460663 RepID=A0A177CXA2_9PLEO|nr:uncharacterized protein CC84DRAFT_1253918 [Paraphaeosphaeria sporulosa]OAG11457.1 hypothetical protein CC84DRAFT_1253918 [Paraphaeosphaeria sporulosa]